MTYPTRPDAEEEERLRKAYREYLARVSMNAAQHNFESVAKTMGYTLEPASRHSHPDLIVYTVTWASAAGRRNWNVIAAKTGPLQYRDLMKQLLDLMARHE